MRAVLDIALLLFATLLLGVNTGADPGDESRAGSKPGSNRLRWIAGSDAVLRGGSMGTTATDCIVVEMSPNETWSTCNFVGVAGNTALLGGGDCYIQFDVFLSNFGCAGELTTWQVTAGLLSTLPDGLSRGMPPACMSNQDCENVGWCPVGSKDCCPTLGFCSFVYIDDVRPDGPAYTIEACGPGGGLIACGGTALPKDPPEIDDGPSYLMSIKLYVEPDAMGVMVIDYLNIDIDTFVQIDGEPTPIGKTIPGIAEIPLGQCCDLSLDGGCVDGIFGNECDALFAENFFAPGGTCADSCPPALYGACCDSTPFVVECQDNALVDQCLGENETFFPGVLCAEITCAEDAIPTVSEWGLVILTLLLLSGAKVYFNTTQVKRAA